MTELDYEAVSDEVSAANDLMSDENTATDDTAATDDTDIDSADVNDGNRETDYESLAEDDLAAIRREFREARELSSLTELDDPVRFAELRELGLTPKEAYLATRKPKRADNRSHLSGAAPRGAGSPRTAMTQGELLRAREIFSGMSDREIQSLYKSVSRH